MPVELLATSFLSLKSGPEPVPPRAERADASGATFKEYLESRRAGERPIDSPGAAEQVDQVDDDDGAEVENDDASVKPAEVTPQPVIAEAVLPPAITPVVSTSEAVPLEEVELPTASSDEPAICFGRNQPQSNRQGDAQQIDRPVLPENLHGSLKDAAVPSDSGPTIGRRVPIVTPQPHGAPQVDQYAPTQQPAVPVTPAKPQGSTSPSAQGPQITAQPVVAAPDRPAASTNQTLPATPVVTAQQQAAFPVEGARQSAPLKPAKAKGPKRTETAADPRLTRHADPRAVLRASAPPPDTSNVRPAKPVGDLKVDRIDIQSGVGDGAAASIGRFLISGATDDGDTTSNPAAALELSNTTGSEPGPTGKSASTAPTTSTSFQSTLSRLLVPPTPAGDVVDQAARVLTATANGGRQQVTLQLDPPELGHLRLEIRMQEQAMTLRVDAESHAVARLIESRIGELRDALSTHGIRVERSDVVVRAPSTGESQMQTSDDGSRGQTNHQNMQDETARGSHQDGPDSRSRFSGDEQTRPGGHDRGEPNKSGREDSIILPFVTDTNETSPSSELWIDLVA